MGRTFDPAAAAQEAEPNPLSYKGIGFDRSQAAQLGLCSIARTTCRC